jgi:hypothetical protein
MRKISLARSKTTRSLVLLILIPAILFSYTRFVFAAAPVITAVQAINIIGPGAQITWNTDVPSDSVVYYGVSSTNVSLSSSNSCGATGLVIAHCVNLTGLSSSTTYFYQVRSTGSDSLVSTLGIFQFTSSTQAPAAPSNLTATVSGNNVTLNWTDNSNNETGFKLYRGPIWTDIGNVSANTTTFTDASLPAGTYTYHLNAFNSSSGTPVYSGISNDVSVTVGTTGNTSPATTFPVAPTNLRLKGTMTGNNVPLAWNDNADNEDKYYIHRKLTADSTWPTSGSIFSVSANTTTYTDNSVQPGTSYDFRVQACTAANACSAFAYLSGIITPGTATTPTPTPSPTTPTTAPAAPSNLTATVSGNNVTLNWTDNSNNETGFKLYRGPIWTDIGNVSANTTTFTDASLPAGTYTYHLNAFNSSSGTPVYSGISNDVSITVRGTTIPVGQGKTISGRITYNDNTPVTDANIIVSNATNQTSVSQNTDANGYYLFNLNPGTYTLKLRPVNLETSSWSYNADFGNASFATDATSESKTINFVVTKDVASVKVRAVSNTLQPLANVYVSVLSKTTTTAASSQKTNANGEAQLSLNRGTYIIQVFIDLESGYVNPSQQTLSVADSASKELTFIFNRPTESNFLDLSGTTKLENGTAVDAFVWGWSESGESVSMRALPDGSFKFKVKPATVWHLGAAKELNGIPYSFNDLIVKVEDTNLQANLTLAKLQNSLAAPITQSANSTTAIVAKTDDGAAVTVPANSETKSGVYTLEIKPTIEAPTQPSKIPISTIYDVSLRDSSGNKVTNFSSALEVRIPYDKANITSLGLEEKSLNPHYYDEQADVWVPISDYSVDTTNKVVIARVNHLTRFAIVMPADITPPSPPAEWQSIILSTLAVQLSWKKSSKRF